MEVKGKVAYFSNHKVRLVVWRIILSRFGEWISLSSLVQTLPTTSDGCTALQDHVTQVNNLHIQVNSYRQRVLWDPWEGVIFQVLVEIFLVVLGDFSGVVEIFLVLWRFFLVLWRL